MTEPPEIPDLSSRLSQQEATQLRDSLEPEERERVERTVADLLDLLGRSHAMGILRAFAFAETPLRFSELEDELKVAPNTLSSRLSELTEAGLLHREAYDEMPPRVEYVPTERAEMLFPVFAHLHHWAIKYEI